MALLHELINGIKAPASRIPVREPSITAYNRLEARPRATDFERSLRAEVRDALWMLTRQWQLGEFEGEDAGSMIDARILTSQSSVDTFSSDNYTLSYDKSQLPLETIAERERIPVTLLLKVQMGQYFLRLHTDTLKATYSAVYLQNFGLDTNLDISDSFKGKLESQLLYKAVRRNAIDGEKIFSAIADGSFYTLTNISQTDADMSAIIADYSAWYSRQYCQPDTVGQSAWRTDQLEYQFGLRATDISTVNTNTPIETKLSAEKYCQDKLDWYSFEVDLQANGPVIDIPQKSIPQKNLAPPKVEKVNFNHQYPIADQIGLPQPVSYIPTRATFKGMPNPRFWEMEDSQIDFGKLNAKTTDPLLLLVAQFALVYGNDWFVIPYKIPVNTICEIDALVVTDVFGDRTLIQAADKAAGSQWQQWSMFSLSNQGNIGEYNGKFFLPPTVLDHFESETIEQVNFIRDDVALMVWGVEEIIPDETGVGVSGKEASYGTEIAPAPITNSAAKIRYVYGTAVPQNWIPFLPVQKPGAVGQEIYLRRAVMPDLGGGNGVVNPRGVILNESKHINEEEIPVAGTIVTRSYKRTRWFDGKTVVWIGRRKEAGRGKGSSNLRFDQIEFVS